MIYMKTGSSMEKFQSNFIKLTYDANTHDM